MRWCGWVLVWVLAGVAWGQEGVTVQVEDAALAPLIRRVASAEGVPCVVVPRDLGGARVGVSLEGVAFEAALEALGEAGSVEVRVVRSRDAERRVLGVVAWGPGATSEQVEREVEALLLLAQELREVGRQVDVGRLREEVEAILAERRASYEALGSSASMEGLQAQQREEQRLQGELLGLGVGVVPVLVELGGEEPGAGDRVVLAKAVAQSGDGASVRRVLQEAEDGAVVVTLVRYMPETEATLDALVEAFAEQPRARVRVMLVREVWRRGAGDARAHALARAGVEDASPEVQAEALTCLGRAGEAEDAEVCRRVVEDAEASLALRQRAVVAFAECAGAEGVEALRAWVGDAEVPLALRAAVVLGLGRLGEAGRGALEEVAEGDEQELAVRARRLLESQRRE